MSRTRGPRTPAGRRTGVRRLAADPSPRRRLRAALCSAAFVLGTASGPAALLAQEHGEGGPTSPEEILKRVVEIEKLMRQAESALARSTDERAAREAETRIAKLLEEKAQKEAGKSSEALRREAEGGSREATELLRRLTEEARSECEAAGGALEKLLDEKARQEAGKSAEELRRLAEQGSREAEEALRRLTDAAQREAGSATEGVRKLLEEVEKSSKGSSQGIQWILDNAVSRGGTRRQDDPGGGKPQDGKDPHSEPQKPQKEPQGKKPEDGKDPKDPQNREKSDQPPPESDREKPRSPEFERWFAELPDQVRKQYETQDWDSIPVKWRAFLRDWMKKMNDEMEKGR